MRLPLPVFPVALLLLWSGCSVSIPQPAYRKVDQEAPAFKEAVALEKGRQQEKGKSPAKAEEIAVKKVSKEVVKVESQRRAEQVAPLSKALTAFERPRGCWAYTFTTTTRTKDNTTVDVARFDAFQPEERLWTLVSRDGQAPDEKTQADYRRAQLRTWKKAADRATSSRGRKNTEAAHMWNVSSFADLEMTGPDSTGQTSYTFANVHGHFPLVGDIPAGRTTYVTDSARDTVVSKTDAFLEPWSVLGGAIKFEIWDSSSDYILVEPELPPFPSKTKLHYHVHVFGQDSGEREIETVYSDYRRVKCYDERFEVKIGAPNVSDFIP